MLSFNLGKRVCGLVALALVSVVVLTFVNVSLFWHGRDGRGDKPTGSNVFIVSPSAVATSGGVCTDCVRVLNGWRCATRLTSGANWCMEEGELCEVEGICGEP